MSCPCRLLSQWISCSIIERLARAWDRFSYVVDLTEAKRPDPETRAVLARVLRFRASRASRSRLGQPAHARDGAAVRIRHGTHERGHHATRAEAIEEARRVMGQ